jgi:hypothetical protein
MLFFVGVGGGNEEEGDEGEEEEEATFSLSPSEGEISEGGKEGMKGGPLLLSPSMSEVGEDEEWNG